VDLKEYEHFKFDLADIVRVAAAALPLRSEMRYNEVRDLLARLAEDRFNLVVIGRFSRGKSTLMNAILGTDRLPTGVVPLTSVVTTVTYGSDEKVVLYYENSSLFSDIPLSQLEENITERGNPGNIKRIRTAEVQIPADILRRGFHFIDTPGLGSSIRANTETTEAFLPQADAFILVTSYDSPLSEEETRILEIIQHSGRHCFVVLNKQDSVNEAERAEVQAHVERELSAIFGEASATLFSVSASQAMAARLANDGAALRLSGLPSLEDALIEFLTTAKQREFLLGMIARVAEFGRNANAGTSVEQRLATLKGRITDVASHQRDRETQTDHGLSLAEFKDCEICRHVSETLFDFLASFQGRLRDDLDVQREHASSGGLCGRHATQFEALAAPQETCIGFAPVLERQARQIREAIGLSETSFGYGTAVAKLLPRANTCQACQIARKATSERARATAQRLEAAGAEKEIHSIFCLPHLSEILLHLPPDRSREILERQALILDYLATDMRRFALKQEGAKRYLSSREELTAAKRGLRALLGDPRAAEDERERFLERPSDSSSSAQV